MISSITYFRCFCISCLLLKTIFAITQPLPSFPLALNTLEFVTLCTTMVIQHEVIQYVPSPIDLAIKCIPCITFTYLGNIILLVCLFVTSNNDHLLLLPASSGNFTKTRTLAKINKLNSCTKQARKFVARNAATTRNCTNRRMCHSKVAWTGFQRAPMRASCVRIFKCVVNTIKALYCRLQRWSRADSIV